MTARLELRVHSGDYEAFCTLIDSLCVASNRPAGDDVRRVYWEPLKTQSIGGLRRRIEFLLATRKSTDRFPTPADLRPEDSGPKVLSEGERAHMEKRDRHSAAHWDEYLKNDPEEARLKLIQARCGRILSTEHASSPAYAQALEEDRVAQRQLLTLWERRGKERAAA